MELAELRLEPATGSVEVLAAGIDEPTDRGVAVRTVALNRHMLPFALALVAGALFNPTPVHGLTLGDVSSLSALGQPLRVAIPVTLASGETLHVACVRLVADNTVNTMPQIVTAKVSLEQVASGTRLMITTPTSVSEPALRLAVQTGCGSAMRRDYVLLLDPPSTESPTMVAAAEPDEAPWLRHPRKDTAVASATPRQSAPVASPLPRTTWGTPVPTAEAVAEARPKAAEKIAPEVKTVAAEAVAASAAPRELTTVTTSSGVGSFISEAAAASLPPRTAAPRTTSAQSLSQPQQLVWRAQSQPPVVSIWQQMWPYAFAICCTITLALVAYVVHRRHTVATSWMDPKARTTLRGETQAGAQQVTFAHFGAMTEPAPASVRAPLTLPPLPERSAETSELDTLLQDIQADMIDERTIKDAWKAAAGDSPTDMGTDSILRAIAAAERDLQIGAPEPAQVAMDTALDKDLMTIPNVPMKVKLG